MQATANDVLYYLMRLKSIKQELGPDYIYSFDEEVYTIFNSENIPILSLTKKNFEIFQEIEV